MRKGVTKIQAGVMMEPELYAKVRELADKLERSFSWVACQAMIDYLHEFDFDKYYLAKIEAHNAEVSEV